MKSLVKGIIARDAFICFSMFRTPGEIILVFDLIHTSQWKAENRSKISHFPKEVALNTVMNVV